MAYERPPEQAPLWAMPELPTAAELEGYHVTDDPQKVLTTLRAGLLPNRGRDAPPSNDLQASN